MTWPLGYYIFYREQILYRTHYQAHRLAPLVRRSCVCVCVRVCARAANASPWNLLAQLKLDRNGRSLYSVSKSLYSGKTGETARGQANDQANQCWRLGVAAVVVASVVVSLFFSFLFCDCHAGGSRGQFMAWWLLPLAFSGTSLSRSSSVMPVSR